MADSDGYQRALRAVVARKATLVSQGSHAYGWLDTEHYDHPRQCGWTEESLAAAEVKEDVWTEWGGTFGDDTYRHGVTMTGLTCRCGLLVNRRVRWDATLMDALDALLKEES